jgi:hypothetical protein
MILDKLPEFLCFHYTGYSIYKGTFNKKYCCGFPCKYFREEKSIIELKWFLLRNTATNALEPWCCQWPTIIFKSKIQPSIFAFSSIFYINKNFTSNGTKIKDSNLRIMDSFKTGGVQNFTLAYFIEILPNYKISKTDFSFEWPSSRLQRELITYYKLLYVSTSTIIVRWYITRYSLNEMSLTGLPYGNTDQILVNGLHHARRKFDLRRIYDQLQYGPLSLIIQGDYKRNDGLWYVISS